MADRLLHIGLDFDDTLMHTREGLVELLNRLHNTSINIEDCHDYYLSEPWKLTEDQFHAMFEAHEAHLHKQPPLEGLLETLESWMPRARFSVITGRPEFWLPSAIEWLAKHQVPIENIVAAKARGGKGAVARALGVDFFVEDHGTFAQEVLDAGIPVYLLDRPYNQNLAHPLMTRVKDWHEIRQLVETKFPPPPTTNISHQ